MGGGAVRTNGASRTSGARICDRLIPFCHAEAKMKIESMINATQDETHDYHRARNGKIARLPFAIRQAVNEMLLDGLNYRQIVSQLAHLGYPGMRPQNLSEWRKGGYQDWLERQEELENLDQDRQAAIALAQDPAAQRNLDEANDLLLSVRFQRALMDHKPRSVPQFVKLANAVIHQTRERTRRDSLALAARRHADKTSTRARPSSDEQSDHIRPCPT